jgi:hypothetical protein
LIETGFHEQAASLVGSARPLPPDATGDTGTVGPERSPWRVPTGRVIMRLFSFSQATLVSPGIRCVIYSILRIFSPNMDLAE